MQNKHGVPTEDIMNRLARDFAVSSSLNRTTSDKQTYRSSSEKETAIRAYFDGDRSMGPL